MALPNPGMDFVPFDILTAEEMDDLVENIEALAAGTGLNDGSITPSKLLDRTRYVGIGYTKVAMNDGSTIVGIPLSGFHIPVDWVPGTDIVIKCTSRNTVGSGVVARRFDSYRFRNSAALTIIDNAINVNRTVSNTNVAYSTLSTLPGSSFVAGDSIGISLSRLGADGTDTNTGIEDCDISWAEYTADS